MDLKTVIFATAHKRLAEKFSDDQAKRLAGYLVAQAQHETGNFSSDAFNRNNNIGGYKPYVGSLYQVNPQPAGANKKYAYFPSIESSVLEIVDWIRRRYSSFVDVSSIAAYAAALKKERYYEDTVQNYTKGLTFYFSALVVDGFNAVESILSGNFKAADLKPLGILILIVISFFWLIRKTRIY